MSHSTCVQARPLVPARALPYPLSTLAAGAGIVFYFYYFAVTGLLAEFTHDDLMNLTVAWRPGLTAHLRDALLFFRIGESHRPVGSVFYRLLFEIAGFHPLPYRAACYGLLTANLWLAWQMALHLTRSRRQAFAVTLLLSYHGSLWPLYLSSGFCFDLLCFFFYGCAMVFYLRRRKHGLLDAKQTAVWAALYVLCLGSKEIAVSLPVVTLAYEWLRQPPRCWRWFWREGRTALVGGAITLVYLLGRMTSPNSLAKLDAYRPDLRPEIFADRTGRLISEVFYDPRPHNFALLAAVLIALPLLVRSRPLRLGAIWMTAGVLPIAFIAPRGLAQAYVPVFGLALMLVAAGNAVLRYLPPRGRPLLVYAILPAALAICHSLYGSLDHLGSAAEGSRIRTAYEQLQALSPAYPPNARVLLLDDPFPENDWSTTFLVYLHSLRRDAVVGRATLWQNWAGADERLSFDVVISYDQGKLVQCDDRDFRELPPRNLKKDRCRAIAIAYP